MSAEATGAIAMRALLALEVALLAGATTLLLAGLRPAGRVRPLLAWRLLGAAAATDLALAFLIPDGVPRLVGTEAGRFLLLELALVGLGCALGPFRSRWRARMAAALGVGAAVLALRLLAAPPQSEPVIWPFAFRFAPGITWPVGTLRAQILAGAIFVFLGLSALVGAYLLRSLRPLLVVSGAALAAFGGYHAGSAMTVDAYPTTYQRPPIPYGPESIARGRALFMTHCVACHGTAGRGDGPAASGLIQRPADLTASHTVDHTSGDIYWWLTHGLGLAMPAFGDTLSPEERWNLVQFVRSLSKPERL